MAAADPRATRFYRALLRLLPFDFRSDFGPSPCAWNSEVGQTFLSVPFQDCVNKKRTGQECLSYIVGRPESESVKL